MSRVSKKTFLNTRETRQSGFSRRKEKTKEKAGRHLPPVRAKIRRAVQIELPNVNHSIQNRRSMQKYRPTVERFFVFPCEPLSAPMKKTQGRAGAKETVSEEKYFPRGGAKIPKTTGKTSASAAMPREYAAPRRSYRPVWRCILPPRREWFRHRISGPASRVCSTVRAATVRPRATG